LRGALRNPDAAGLPFRCAPTLGPRPLTNVQPLRATPCQFGSSRRQQTPARPLLHRPTIWRRRG
jgi:hypothetical protein